MMRTRHSQPNVDKTNLIASTILDIRVINLDRSPDRLAVFEKANSSVMPHVTRFRAIDGKSVNRAEFVERGIITPDLEYKAGSLGNALSHIALWETAMRENRALTICEDDAIFNRSFCEAGELLLRGLPADWHLMRWGWNFDSILWFDMIPGVSSCIGWFDQSSLQNGIDKFQAASPCPRSYRFYQAFGTVCYSISPGGARLLWEKCLPLRNKSVYFPGLKTNVTNFGLDVALNDLYGQLASFVCFPPLVATTNDHSTSTVQGSSP